MNTIGILGAGKLGLCLALSLEDAGFDVLSYDINIDILDKIQNKTLESNEPYVMNMLKKSKNLNVTKNITDVLQRPIIFIVVNTPSKNDGAYDHSAIDSIVNDMETYYSNNPNTNTKYVVIVSTVMPKYCDSIQTKLSSYNIDIIYNPEFIAQGSIIKDTLNPDMILIGSNSIKGGNIIENIHMKLVRNMPTICKMSCLEAEITKISLNCFLTTKIAFGNCIGDLAVSQNCNPNTILNAIGSDTRIGKKYLKYGFGYGGPCLPRDNRAYNYFSRQQNMNNLIGEASDNLNTIHSEFLYNKIKKILDTENKSVLFNQLTYKKNTCLIEESKQFELANLLANSGYNVYAQEIESVKEYINSKFPDHKIIFINSIDNLVNYLTIDDLIQIT